MGETENDRERRKKDKESRNAEELDSQNLCNRRIASLRPHARILLPRTEGNYAGQPVTHEETVGNTERWQHILPSELSSISDPYT